MVPAKPVVQMDSENHLPDYIALGELLWFVKSKQNLKAIKRQIPSFFELIKKCGLHHTHTAANPLGESDFWLDYEKYGTSNITLAKIYAIAESIDGVMKKEAGERILVVADVEGVSRRLRELSDVLKEAKAYELTASQELLREETATCIERGAYRAAGVMG